MCPCRLYCRAHISSGAFRTTTNLSYFHTQTSKNKKTEPNCLKKACDVMVWIWTWKKEHICKFITWKKYVHANDHRPERKTSSSHSSNSHKQTNNQAYGWTSIHRYKSIRANGLIILRGNGWIRRFSLISLSYLERFDRKRKSSQLIVANTNTPINLSFFFCFTYLHFN